MKYLLAIDLETTGLNPSYNQIIQVGAILLDSKLQELGRVNRLVKPVNPERGRDPCIPVKDKMLTSYEFTGITEESLETAPLVWEVITELDQMVALHTDDPKEVVLFGENTRFDQAFLQQAYHDSALKWPFDYHVIALESVYTSYKFVIDGLLPERIGLGTSSKEMGVVNPQAHDAIADIETTIAVYKKILYKIQDWQNCYISK